MPTVNHAFKEITLKIVYYGPGAGGKTTNLRYIHSNVPSKHRGELTELATEQDRTLFFDHLPLDIGDVKGFKTKFQLYTVPGQVYYNATRKLVLRGVDGIVFVADSQASRFQDSIDSYLNLVENLRDYGLELETMPFAMQYNKRDSPDSVPLDKLQAALNPEMKYKEFEAIATDGVGVRETLREVSSQCLKKLQESANISSDEAIVQERLGVGDAAMAGGPKMVSQADRNAPDISVFGQESSVKWRGMAVGSGQFSLSTDRKESGEVEYTLSSKHKVIGGSKSLRRMLRYIGEEPRDENGVERVYHVFRDVTPGGQAKVTTFVEKSDSTPNLYLLYPGFMGEIKVAPAGATSSPF